MRTRKSGGFTIIEVVVVVFVLSTLAAVAIPTWRRALHKADYAGCVENIRNVSTMVQCYSIDNADTAPSSVTPLMPRYLAVIPTCPAAGQDTYSAGYQVDVVTQNFTLSCGTTANHSPLGLQAGEPYFTPTRGLGP